MRRKRSTSVAVWVMVVRFILQDETRTQIDEQINYYAGATRQGKTTEQLKKYEKPDDHQNSKYPQIIQLQVRASRTDLTQSTSSPA